MISGLSLGCLATRLAPACLALALALNLFAAAASTAVSPNQQQASSVSGGGGGQATSAASDVAGGSKQTTGSGGLLEAELNSMVQQHGLDAEGESSANKQLAEAIISRLMVDNLMGSSAWRPNTNNDDELLSEAVDGLDDDSQQQQPQQQQQQVAELTGPESMRLKKLLGLLHSYDQSVAASSQGLNGGQALFQYPPLPNSQAATMKRAAMRMVQQQQQQQQQRHLSPYARANQFDFGLGKRQPVGGGVDGRLLAGGMSPIARFGDLSASDMAGGMGQAQPVSQFIYKRPSSHGRYDFGLGKRVASPYPRYDFGLGKRAPNRIRYDFGLGKK